jgi:Flp pilus assembly protein TadD
MEQGEIEVLLEVGQSYLINKEYENAIKKFSEALRINPHDPELYYSLGLALEGAEKYTDAVEAYEKTLKLDKTFSNAEIRLSEVQKKVEQAKKPSKDKEQ